VFLRDAWWPRPCPLQVLSYPEGIFLNVLRASVATPLNPWLGAGSSQLCVFLHVLQNIMYHWILFWLLDAKGHFDGLSAHRWCCRSFLVRVKRAHLWGFWIFCLKIGMHTSIYVVGHFIWSIQVMLTFKLVYLNIINDFFATVNKNKIKLLPLNF